MALPTPVIVVAAACVISAVAVGFPKVLTVKLTPLALSCAIFAGVNKFVVKSARLNRL